MDVEDIESPKQPASKYSRVNSNGTRLDSSKMGLVGDGGQGNSKLHDNPDLVSGAGPITTMAAVSGGGEVVPSKRFGRQWQHSSRIIRVSRASGGKDRHSKVWTAKGPRDRRVRLSVTTAIQFYDLQDRLGYDQPSKAVEWLIKAAADEINELPCLNTSNFPPDTPGQVSDDRRSGNHNNGVDSADIDFNTCTNFIQDQSQHPQVGCSMSKSGCSSNNSETSKGSGLSLSRSEIRIKARERARERTAKEKDRETEPLSCTQNSQRQHPNVSSMPHTSSFTQLLTGGISNLNENAASSTPSPLHCRSNDPTSNRLQWLSSNCTTPMADYFGSGLMGFSTTTRPHHSVQHLSQVMTLSPFGATVDNTHQHQNHHQQQQHFSFMADQHHHLVQVPNNTATMGVSDGGSDYNLNFSMSSTSTTSGLAAGFNRGTLQSNSSSSPSLMTYLQRYSTTDGVSSVPFFLGGAPISPNVDNQHPHPHHHSYDPAGLQLCYGDHSDQKTKGKN